MDDTEQMDAVVVVDVRIRGKNGRLFPPRMPMPLAERKRLRAIEHDLRCRQHLPFRQVQAAMLKMGVRRSRGQIHKDITGWRCPYCTPQPPPPPDPAQRVQVHAWR